MRSLSTGVVALLVAATMTSAQQPATDAAAKVLTSTRAALGGEPRLSAVKSFTATGRTRRVQGDNLVPIEFEILCELPDKYVRKDEIPAQESGPTTSGFNGAGLVQIPALVVPTRPGAPAPPQAQLDAARDARVNLLKQDFVRLTLGMFAGSFSAAPLTFTYAGQAEAPQGKADVLDVKVAPNLPLRLFVNSETHLPIMVSWQVSPPVRGRGPAPAAAPGAGPAPPPATAQPALAKPVEHRMYYADYRDVDGLQLPFRIRRAVGSDTTEETTFDRIRLNAKIDPKKFEAQK